MTTKSNHLTPSRIVSILLASLALTACTPRDDEQDVPSSSYDTGQLQGRFVDSPVEGLSYKTQTIAGVTGADGQFSYAAGETIEFTIGNVTLGAAQAARLLTPISLVPGATSDLDSVVANIAQLLQSIDDDADVENGIQITDSMRAAAATRTVDLRQSTDAFLSDPRVREFVAALTAVSAAGPRSLVDRAAAQVHLRHTLAEELTTNCDASSCLRIPDLWSGQFPGITTNGVAGDVIFAGQQALEVRGPKYILMGARADGTARFKARVIGQGAATNALVRLGLEVARPLRIEDTEVTHEIVLIGQSYPVTTGLVDMQIDLSSELPLGAEREKILTFHVATGFDRNMNDTLDDEPGNREIVRASPWRFFVVSPARYQETLPYLTTLVALLFPGIANDFATIFLSGRGPSDFPPRTQVLLEEVEQKWNVIRDTYGTSDPCLPDHSCIFPPNEIYPLSHKVGIDYRTDGRGVLGSYRFGPASAVTQKILSSALFEEKIIATLLAEMASDALAAPTSRSASVRTAERFEWAERELYLGFGTVYIDATLTAVAACVNNELTVSNARVSGEVWHLYDYNFSSAGLAPGLPNPLPDFAMVQAGFGTLSPETSVQGQVFQVQAMLDAPLPEYDGPSIPCRSPPVVAIVANPPIVSVNQSVTLTWTLANDATVCRASGDWTGTKAIGGSEVVNVGAGVGTRRYVLACEGPGGIGEASTTVAVTSPDGPGSSNCERVSAGSTSVIVSNQLGTGLEAFFPELAFGANLAAGECNIVGFDFAGTEVTIHIELTQCSNTPGDTSCEGRTVGSTQTKTLHLSRGDSQTVVVTPATFAI
jgi:hypothetical protein